MKKLILILVTAALPLTGKAQAVAPAVTVGPAKSEITLVVQTPGSQDELFVRGKDWLFRTFNSGKTIEQYEDKTAGRLVAHPRTASLTWKAGLGIVNDAGDFSYNLTLDFKEGKARILIDNVVYQKGTQHNSMILQSGANLNDEYPANWPTFGKKSMLAHWQQMQASATNELVLLEQSFYAAMSKAKSDF